MKVLFVIDQLNQGGTERVAVDLAILLSKERDIEVSFYCLLIPSDLDSELVAHGIKVNYLNRKFKYNPIKLLELYFEFKNYNIIHVHSRQVLRYIGLIYFTPINKNFRIVFQDHYGLITKDKRYSLYLKFCIKKIDAYIGVSQTLVNWARKNELNKRTKLLPNIIRKRNDFIKLNRPSDIIIVGNFRPQKNYEFLCEVISKLPNTITVDLYGNATDKSYYRKIISLSEKLNIESRLNIRTGESNVLALLKNYKIGLHCAESETGPLVALEYLSCDLPFLMYETGEVAKVLKKHNSNMLMNNFNSSNWAQHILNMLQNQKWRDEIVCHNHKIFNEYYTEKSYIIKCLKIYKEILDF